MIGWWIGLILMILISLTYVRSGYNTHYFHVLNVMFFLSFILSMYALYMQQRQFDMERKSRWIAPILQQLYDIEAQTRPPPLQILRCLETIHYLEETSVLAPAQLGKRLSVLVRTPSFNEYWKDHSDLYPPEIDKLIENLKNLEI